MRAWPWLTVSLMIGSGCLLPELKDLGGSAASDAGTAPDGPLLDSGVDATTDATIDGAAPCPSGWFCDDFDQGPLGATWSAVATLDGTLTLETGGLSTPNFVRMDLLAPKGASRHAYLEKTFTLAPTRAVCSFAVRVPSRPATGDFQLLEIRDSATHLVYVKVYVNGTELGEEATGADGGNADRFIHLTTANGGIPDATWTTTTLDVDYGAKTVNLSVTPLGGKTATTSLGNLLVAPNAKSVVVSLGDTGDSDNPLFTAHLDDLRCHVF